MNKISCLIVDDEPIARSILVNYCNAVPALEIAGQCGNSLDARKEMMHKDIQLLFLDINMPVLDGIAFLKTLKNRPQIIFTTAYKEYAATAFDLSACDYLVKPFSLERFIISVDRALERIQHMNRPAVPADNLPDEGFLSFKTEGKIFRLKNEDLLYAEASGNHTRLITINGLIVLPMSFTAVEQMLAGKYFIRVHRSFMVNKSRISLIQGQLLFLDKLEIPIGKSYRNELLQMLGL